MDPVDGASIGVEVVYSPCAGEFDCVRVRLPVGATVGDAVRLSGMRMARINEKGEREVMDDKMRAEEMKRAREMADADCAK